MSSQSPELAERVLVLTPTGRDAALACDLMAEAGLNATACADMTGLCAAVDEGAGAVLLVNEAITESSARLLEETLMRQPQWSELPLVILAHSEDVGSRSPEWLRAITATGNTTLLVRPLYKEVLLSALQAALRARRRQYEVMASLIERERSEQQLRWLAGELNHRVKNSLATVNSIAHQTFRNHPSPAVSAFLGRLAALAQAHDLAIDGGTSGVPLRQLAREVLAPYGDGERGALRLAGVDLVLKAPAAVAIGMTLHELATNAAKYGALSVPQGRVDVAWRVEDAGEPQRLEMHWQEMDGPPVNPPRRRGFGRRLIEHGVVYDLNGHVDLAFRPDGVLCRVVIPLTDQIGVSHDRLDDDTSRRFTIRDPEPRAETNRHPG